MPKYSIFKKGNNLPVCPSRATTLDGYPTLFGAARQGLVDEIERGMITDSGEYIVAVVFGDQSVGLYEFTVAEPKLVVL